MKRKFVGFSQKEWSAFLGLCDDVERHTESVDQMDLLLSVLAHLVKDSQHRATPDQKWRWEHEIHAPDLSLLADTFQLLADFAGECDRQKEFDSEKVMITIESLHQCIAQKTLKALGKA
jgi:hypothetical protein